MWIDLLWMLLIVVAMYLGYILRVGYWGKVVIASGISLLVSLLLGAWLVLQTGRLLGNHDPYINLSLYLLVAVIWNVLIFKIYKYMDRHYQMEKLGVVNQMLSALLMALVFSISLAHLVAFGKESKLIPTDLLESSISHTHLNKISNWTDMLFSSGKEAVEEIKELTGESFD